MVYQDQLGLDYRELYGTCYEITYSKFENSKTFGRKFGNTSKLKLGRWEGVLNLEDLEKHCKMSIGCKQLFEKHRLRHNRDTALTSWRKSLKFAEQFALRYDRIFQRWCESRIFFVGRPESVDAP